MKIKNEKFLIYDIKNLSEKEYQRTYSLMSLESQRRIDRFCFEEDKKRSVAGEMLARKLISLNSDFSEPEIKFKRSEYGKPYAEGTDIHFNISHSFDMVICAVSDNPIGVDIEKIREVNLDVAKRFFNEQELFYVFSKKPSLSDFKKSADINILKRFFEIWTAKEAYVKFKGKTIKDIKNSKITNAYITTEFYKDYCISVCK